MVKQVAMVDIPWELNQCILRCKAEIRILSHILVVTGFSPSDSTHNNCKWICMKIVPPSFVITSDSVGRIFTYIFIDLILGTLVILAINPHILLSDYLLKHIKSRNFSHICLNEVVFKTIITHKLNQLVILLSCKKVQVVAQLTIGEIIESRVFRILIKI
jgi:hypothetical protein